MEDASGEGVVGRELCKPGDGTGYWLSEGRDIAAGVEKLGRGEVVVAVSSLLTPGMPGLPLCLVVIKRIVVIGRAFGRLLRSGNGGTVRV